MPTTLRADDVAIGDLNADSLKPKDEPVKVKKSKFTSVFSDEKPKKISDEDRCYSKDLDKLIYLLILISIVTMIMILQAYSAEHPIDDKLTDKIFKDMLSNDPKVWAKNL